MSHSEARELLHAYAHAIFMGSAPEVAHPSVAAHLASCALCRAELSGLLAVSEAAASPAEQALQPHPGPDLSRLTWPEQPAGEADPPFIDNLRRLWLAFSEERLRGWQTPAVVGAMRGALLYAYEEEGLARAIDLRIQIYAESDPALVSLVVTVAAAASDELDQSGTQVALYGDGLQQQARTDSAGTVRFRGLPRAALPRLRLAVTLDRTA